MILIFKKILFILNTFVVLVLGLLICSWSYKNEHYGMTYPDSGLDLDGALAIIILGGIVFLINRIVLLIYKKSKAMFFIILIADSLILYKVISIFLSYKEYSLYLLMY